MANLIKRREKHSPELEREFDYLSEQVPHKDNVMKRNTEDTLTFFVSPTEGGAATQKITVKKGEIISWK
jgi:hypothetical protein